MPFSAIFLAYYLIALFCNQGNFENPTVKPTSSGCRGPPVINKKKCAKHALQFCFSTLKVYVRIYGQLQYAKRKRRPVNAILHALLMIAPRPRQIVKRNARFARPNMNYFTMLSSLSNEMGMDITFLLVIM